MNIAFTKIYFIDKFQRQIFDKLSTPFLVLPALIEAVTQ